VPIEKVNSEGITVKHIIQVICLDIDFSTAYPTVMNLLEVSDFGKLLKKEKPDTILIDFFLLNPITYKFQKQSQ